MNIPCKKLDFFFHFFFVSSFEMDSLYIALTVLEFTVLTRLASEYWD